MSVAVHADPDLAQLVALFHTRFEDLGAFSPVLAEAMPQPYRDLLAHEHHMTVTVENHHRTSVDVEVLDARVQGEHYLRSIVLRRKTDHAVVQYGIVRLDLTRLDETPRREILSQKIPLGRVLIQHGVLRTIHLSRLWRVACGPTAAKLFSCQEGTITYGRTAAILTSGTPAIELLEVVSPAE
ncbi:MAG: hypothetical protein QM811_29390 [Pirellulales bacterium]